MQPQNVLDLREVGEIIKAIKQLARKYRLLTGRPLGVTGEIAEFEAARLLDLQLATVRQPGFDAIGRKGSSSVRYQIKGRCILEKKKRGGRVPAIERGGEWDYVLLVLLDEDLEPTSIYQASRPDVIRALTLPGSKARNERSQLGLSQFKAISRLVWNRDSSKQSNDQVQRTANRRR